MLGLGIVKEGKLYLQRVGLGIGLPREHTSGDEQIYINNGMGYIL